MDISFENQSQAQILKLGEGCSITACRRSKLSLMALKRQARAAHDRLKMSSDCSLNSFDQYG
jgi:hypothetical protein